MSYLYTMGNSCRLLMLFLIVLSCSCGDRKVELSESHLPYKDKKETEKDSCCKDDQKDCCKKPEKSETSEIKCPKCGHKEIEKLPTEVCQLFYNCKKCGFEMHPKDGDCCVFCSYGDHKCPSKQ